MRKEVPPFWEALVTARSNPTYEAIGLLQVAFWRLKPTERDACLQVLNSRGLRYLGMELQWMAQIRDGLGMHCPEHPPLTKYRQ